MLPCENELYHENYPREGAWSRNLSFYTCLLAMGDLTRVTGTKNKKRSSQAEHAYRHVVL